MMFDIAPIHVVGVAAGLALLYQSLSLVRDRKEGVFEFLLWAGFGVGLLVISIGSALDAVDILASLVWLLAALGFNLGTDSVFFVSNLLLLFIVFYTYVQLVESRKRISDLAREVALLRYELDDRVEDGDD